MLLSIVTMILMLNQAAIQELRSGDWPAAAHIWRQTLDLSEQSYGPKHPVTAILLRNLATVYRRQQLYRKSEVLAQRSITILEARFGSEDSTLVPSLTTLAEIYFEEHRYTEAERLLQRALAVGAANPDGHYATTLHDLAAVYQVQGSSAKANSLYEKSLRIRSSSR